MEPDVTAKIKTFFDRINQVDEGGLNASDADDITNELLDFIDNEGIKINDLKTNDDLKNHDVFDRVIILLLLHDNIRKNQSGHTGSRGNPGDVTGNPPTPGSRNTPSSVTGTPGSVNGVLGSVGGIKADTLQENVNPSLIEIGKLTEEFNNENTDNERKENISKEIENLEKSIIKQLVRNNEIMNDFSNNSDENIKNIFKDNEDPIKEIFKKHGDLIESERDRYIDSINYFKDSIKDVFDNIIGSLKGHFDDIFGPIYNSLVAPLLGIGKSLLTFGKATAGLFGIGGNNEELDESEKQTSFLEKMLKKFTTRGSIYTHDIHTENLIQNMMGKQEDTNNHLGNVTDNLDDVLNIEKARDKRDARSLGDKDGGDMSFFGLPPFVVKAIGTAFLGLGMVVGGLIGWFWKFFEVVKYGTTQLWNLTKWLGNLTKLSGPISRFFGMFANIGKVGPIVNAIKFFSELGTKVGGLIAKGWAFLTNIPMLGKFFVGIAKGIGKLAWPVTILMGAFDFITEFISTEGNILDKLKAGIKGAILGFVDLPMTLLGWIGDKILGLFGVEIEGGLGQKMKDGLMKIVDIFLWPITKYFEMVGWFKDKITGIFGGIKDFVSNIFSLDSIKEKFFSIATSFGNKIIEFKEWVGSIFSLDSIKEKFFSIATSFGNKIIEFKDWVSSIFSLDSIKEKFSNITGSISSKITEFKEWTIGIFSFDNIKEKFFNIIDAITDPFDNLFKWIGDTFNYENIKEKLTNMIKRIPGASLVLGAGESVKETADKVKGFVGDAGESVKGFFSDAGESVKGFFGFGGEDEKKIEHGDKDYTEKGGPGPNSSMPSGRIGNVQDNSFISLLSQIKNILNTKLNQIISILIQGNITSKVVSGMGSAVKSIGSSIGNFLSGKDDKTTPDVKEVVGVGTQLTEVPGATDNDWEDPMGRNKRITSEFGGRIHPVTGKMQGHKGLDMAGPEPGMYGYPIKASKDGVVSIARNLRGYGNVVYVNHDDGYQTRYAHLQDFKVRAGDMVTAGQVIGGMGNTGVGTGPHLHYEVRKDNKALNPKDILSAREGAMIGNQSSEMGIPAEVHPNEAILPLNDSVLSILGEKIAKFISIKEDFKIGKSEGINYDIPYDSPSNNFVKVSQDQIRAQDQISKDFITSIKKAIDGLKDYRMDTDKDINNIMMSTNNNNGSNEPPDQIENGLLLIMNSGWGVT